MIPESKAAPALQPIGLIGLGLMGRGIATRELLRNTDGIELAIGEKVGLVLPDVLRA